MSYKNVSACGPGKQFPKVRKEAQLQQRILCYRNLNYTISNPGYKWWGLMCGQAPDCTTLNVWRIQFPLCGHICLASKLQNMTLKESGHVKKITLK